MTQRLPLGLIAAFSRNGVLGHNNSIPWHHPSDFRFFRRMTIGHTLIMGRKTFESIGKPLPAREHFILTQRAGVEIPRVTVFNNLEHAIETARKDDPCPMIAGGSEIYKLALPQTTLMYLTHIDEDAEGDVFFPEINWENWIELESTTEGVLRFATYQRKDQ